MKATFYATILKYAKYLLQANTILIKKQELWKQGRTMLYLEKDIKHRFNQNNITHQIKIKTILHKFIDMSR